jgi:hypothetical protein
MAPIVWLSYPEGHRLAGACINVLEPCDGTRRVRVEEAKRKRDLQEQNKQLTDITEVYERAWK